jgi:hypothetical protein
MLVPTTYYRKKSIQMSLDPPPIQNISFVKSTGHTPLLLCETNTPWWIHYPTRETPWRSMNNTGHGKLPIGHQGPPTFESEVNTHIQTSEGCPSWWKYPRNIVQARHLLVLTASIVRSVPVSRPLHSPRPFKNRAEPEKKRWERHSGCKICFDCNDHLSPS